MRPFASYIGGDAFRVTGKRAWIDYYLLERQSADAAAKG